MATSTELDIELDTVSSAENTVAITSDTGLPRYNRRLSDKILAAFNHAYAVGEIEIASRIREVLARLDRDLSEGDGQRRDGAIALCQADLWIEFVEARNDYRIVCDKPGMDSAAVATSLEAMKDAYQRWSAL
ncbi:MAG: hypothetical protein O3B37_15390 [Proteobacteria bacterium]|nr:hypothetical protein [Pseudomonadota bacterium]